MFSPFWGSNSWSHVQKCRWASESRSRICWRTVTLWGWRDNFSWCHELCFSEWQLAVLMTVRNLSTVTFSELYNEIANSITTRVSLSGTSEQCRILVIITLKMLRENKRCSIIQLLEEAFPALHAFSRQFPWHTNLHSFLFWTTPLS